MLKLRPVTVTFLVAAKYLEGVKTQIAADLSPDGINAKDRLRLVPVEEGEDPLDPTLYEKHLLNACHGLFKGDSVTCESLDGVQDTLTLRTMPLSAALIDILLVEGFNAFRQYRETLPTPPFKIYTWLPVAVNSVLARCVFDAIPLAEAVSASMGISFDEAAYQLVLVPRGEVVHNPCLPDMYDYEYLPQAFPIPRDQCGRIYIKLGRVLQETDGVLTFDAADYHPEAVSASRQWLSQTSRKIYYVGPLVPRNMTEQGSDEIFQFLDRHLAARGERSVVYISFGSLFWPTDPAKVHAVLDVLIERRVPFVLANSSAFTGLLDESKKRLAEYGDAILTDWVPQQAILGHPATGWCLTHGGHNTVLECALAGVPMIVWPIFTDQPGNAIHLTDHLDVAYELLEVRSGSGLGPIYRTGNTPIGTVAAVRAEMGAVLDHAFGADGEAKRARLRPLRETLARAWADDGVARREVEAFLNDL
ncbi:UDP-Glycosyltransferase/glycogen phosphorylase [Trametes cingulata]|nr:UDP-Glycosyltransferase/glycogen phosphorylase [Trametes cingulata]